MKKILALFVVMCILLTGCASHKEKVDEETFVSIHKNDILKNNSRKYLASRYETVTEKTSYHFLDDTTSGWSWKLSYQKTDDGMNAAIMYADYECYYLDGEIYVSDEMTTHRDEKKYSRLIHFQEEYDKIVNDLLLTDNILKSVYISGQHSERYNDGYIATFEVTITNDVVEEFSAWDVKLHDKMTVVYTLNKDMEIQTVSFYYNRHENKDPIVTTEYIYNKGIYFPPVVKAMREYPSKVTVKIIQNFGLPSEYTEEYLVSRGCKIQGNANLLNRYVFTDLKNKTLWNYSYPVTADMRLYVTG